MHRDFILKIKSIGDTGTFQGVASSYNNVDHGGDTIQAGAFRQSIQSQGKGLPLLWAHSQAEPVGLARLSDSANALIVDGELLLSDPAAQRAYQHLKMGSVKGLSIGFTVPPGKSEDTSNGGRLLKEIRLHEISLVACPMDPHAQVTSVKDVSRLLTSLRPDDMQPNDRAALRAAMKRLAGGSAAECGCDCPECLDGDCAQCSDEDCIDPNCAGSVEKGKALRMDTLHQLQAFARELRAH